MIRRRRDSLTDIYVKKSGLRKLRDLCFLYYRSKRLVSSMERKREQPRNLQPLRYRLGLEIKIRL